MSGGDIRLGIRSIRVLKVLKIGQTNRAAILNFGMIFFEKLDYKCGKKVEKLEVVLNLVFSIIITFCEVWLRLWRWFRKYALKRIQSAQNSKTI